jgi:hypothetical protein
VSNYRVSPSATSAEVEQLASQIVSEKYRYSEWDRKHPNVNAEAEIFEEVLAFLSHIVEQMKHLQIACESQGNQGGIIAVGGALRGGDVAHRITGEPGLIVPASVTFSRSNRRSPRRRVGSRMKIVWGVFDHSEQMVEYFDHSCRPAADDLAAKLSTEKRIRHYVNPVKQPIVDPEDE